MHIIVPNLSPRFRGWVERRATMPAKARYEKEVMASAALGIVCRKGIGVLTASVISAVFTEPSLAICKARKDIPGLPKGSTASLSSLCSRAARYAPEPAWREAAAGSRGDAPRYHALHSKIPRLRRQMLHARCRPSSRYAGFGTGSRLSGARSGAEWSRALTISSRDCTKRFASTGSKCVPAFSSIMENATSGGRPSL